MFPVSIKELCKGIKKEQLGFSFLNRNTEIRTSILKIKTKIRISFYFAETSTLDKSEMLVLDCCLEKNPTMD